MTLMCVPPGILTEIATRGNSSGNDKHIVFTRAGCEVCFSMKLSRDAGRADLPVRVSEIHDHHLDMALMKSTHPFFMNAAASARR